MSVSIFALNLWRRQSCWSKKLQNKKGPYEDSPGLRGAVTGSCDCRFKEEEKKQECSEMTVLALPKLFSLTPMITQSPSARPIVHSWIPFWLGLSIGGEQHERPLRRVGYAG